MRKLTIISFAASVMVASALAGTVPSVVLPETAVGTFKGFVGKMLEDGFLECGTFELTVAETGKLKAKVVTAAGTKSLSAKNWDSVAGGMCAVKLSKKVVTLDLSLDTNAAWDEHQLTGTFAEGGKSYSVIAQRKAFPLAWHFTATGDAVTGWTLAYAADAKSAALTLKVKSDGTTKLTGKLDGMRISASGVEDVSALKQGVLLADFLPMVSVKSDKKTVKRPLYVRANLWLDRKTDHPEGVGTAKFSD